MDIAALANPAIYGLSPYIPGRPETELRQLAVSAAGGLSNLASNENAWGASPQAREAAAVALAEIHRYPDGPACELRSALANSLGVAPERLILGNGSNELLIMLAQSFLSPRHSAVYSRHAFTVYPLAVHMSGARALVAPVTEQYGYDLQAMRRLVVDDTRLIFIANPNNPTGAWIPRSELEAFLSDLPEHVLVVLDEAYFEYVEKPDYPDGIELQHKHARLIVTRSFSKIHGLAGLRIGYGIADPAITELLNRMRQPFNVNHVAQCAAVAALGDSQHVDNSRRHNRLERVRLERGLTALGCNTLDSPANFFSFKLPAGVQPDQLYRDLLCRGIILRQVEQVYRLPGFLRVTVGTEAENRRFLDALTALLS